MRNDMAKVICESPRIGSRYDETVHHHMRAAKRFKVGVDDDGNYDVVDDFGGGRKHGKGSRFGGNTKSFGEHLGPLYRFLDGKVGKNWDKVKAEICENLTPKSTLHQHILLHANEYVEQDTFIGEDGKVWYRSWGGRAEPVYELIRGLWVHPVSKMLHKAKWQSYSQYRKSRSKPAAKPRFVRKDSTHGFVFHEGIWHRCEYISLRDSNWVNKAIDFAKYDYTWERDANGKSVCVYNKVPSYYIDAFGNSFYAKGWNRRGGIWERSYNEYGVPVFITKYQPADSTEIRQNKLRSFHQTK